MGTLPYRAAPPRAHRRGPRDYLGRWRPRSAQTNELFDSVASREAEARLGHIVDLRGIGLLTGEVGSGKTTVCRHLTAGLYRIPYVSLPTGNAIDVYKAIAWGSGLFIERSRTTARQAIRYEVSRLLTNFAMDAEQRLRLILVGLTELRRRLAMAMHESLALRLLVRLHPVDQNTTFTHCTAVPRSTRQVYSRPDSTAISHPMGHRRAPCGPVIP